MNKFTIFFFFAIFMGVSSCTDDKKSEEDGKSTETTMVINVLRFEDIDYAVNKIKIDEILKPIFYLRLIFIVLTIISGPKSPF